MRRYIFAVFLTVVGLTVCGVVLGIIVHFISIEYLNVVRNVPYEALFSGITGAVRYGISNGFGGGFFTGALLGFATIGGIRKIAPVRDLQIAAAIVSAVAFAFALTGGAGAYAVAKLFGPSFLPEHIALQVGSPYRVMCGYGLEYGAAVGAIMSSLTMAVWIWRRRLWQSLEKVCQGVPQK